MTADGRLPAQVQGYAPYRTGVARPRNAPRTAPRDRSLRRKAAGRRRRFAMLVVVPVLLMLGSVYLNTVAAGLDARAAELDVRLDRAREVGERLEVKVAELSGADRIRAPRGGEARYARAEEHYFESLRSKSGGWEERWGTTGRGKTAVALTGQGLAKQGFAAARKPPLAPQTKDASPLVAKSYRSAARGGPAARSAAPPAARRASSTRPQSQDYGRAQEAVDGGGGVRGDGTSPRREGRAHKPDRGRGLQGLRRGAGRWNDPRRRADPRQHS